MSTIKKIGIYTNLLDRAPGPVQPEQQINFGIPLHQAAQEEVGAEGVEEAVAQRVGLEVAGGQAHTVKFVVGRQRYPVAGFDSALGVEAEALAVSGATAAAKVRHAQLPQRLDRSAGVTPAACRCNVCVPDELKWLANLSPEEANFYLRIIFSAKESIFKCFFPISRKYFHFKDACVKIKKNK